MLRAPGVHVGFADSGAHLRNIAFYNFGLHLLKLVNDDGDRPFLSLERAVHKLTMEPAEWFGLDAGHLTLGARADVVVVNPAGLDASLFDYHEASMPNMGGLMRMVRRNDEAVSATLIGGRVAYRSGAFASDYGASRYGRFLRAHVVDREPIVPRREPLAAIG